MIQQKQFKINYINYVNALAIILAVISNFLDVNLSGSGLSKSLFFYINLLYVPLIFVINGIQIRELNYDRQQIKNNTVSYLSLYVLMKISVCVTKVMLGEKFSFNLFSESGAPWYFFTIAVYTYLAFILRNVNKKIILVISLTLALLCGYESAIGDHFVLSRSITFFPFFVIGQSINIENVIVIKEKKSLKIVGLILLFVLLFGITHFINQIYFLRPLLTGRNPYIELGNKACAGAFYRGFLYVISVGLIGIVLILVPNQLMKRKIVDHIGQNFIVIYFIYRPVLYILVKFDVPQIMINAFGWRIGHMGWIICAILVVFIVSEIWERVSNQFLILVKKIKDICYNIWVQFFYSNSWIRKDYIIIYTISFLLSFLLVYSPYLISGKTFVWGTEDGRSQHYPVLVYTCLYLKRIVKNVIQGKLSIPLFDICIGSGDDVIGFISSLGGTDPIQMLFAMMTPIKYSEFLYGFLTIFRIYLAGLSFSYLCYYFKKDMKCSLLGSIVYCFCGYAIYYSMRHPYFNNPMYLLPILIVGIDKIINKKRPYVFIIGIFYSALCGYYHVYMMTLMIGIYALIRLRDLYSVNRIRELICAFGRGMCAYVSGIGLSAVFFFPSVAEFLQGNRSGYSNYLGSYSTSYYLTGLLRFVSPPSSDDNMAFAAIVIPTIMLLFCCKGRRTLKTVTAVVFVFWLSSLGGLIMNGFQYSTNRWTFGMSLVIAFIVAEMLPELFDLSYKMRSIFIVMSCLLPVIILLTEAARRTDYVLVGIVFLLLTAIFLTVIQWKNAEIRYAVFLALIMINVGINGIYSFSSDQGNMIGGFQKKGYEYARLQESAENEIKAYFNTVIDGRADSTSFMRNTAMVWSVPGMLTYSSVANAGIIEFWKQIETCEKRQAFQIFSTDQRTIINTLLSGKYHLESPDKLINIPFGYELVDTTEKGNKIYQNKYSLPWGYTYDRTISYDDLNSMNGLQKQEAMLQAIAINNDIDFGLENKNIIFDEQKIPYDIQSTGCSWKDGKLIVKEKNATIKLTFQMPEEVEGYLRLSGFDINNSGLTNFDVKINCEGIDKWTRAESNLYTWYYGRENNLINLGYSNKKRTNCTIKFPLKGTFKLNDIELYALPMVNYPERVEKLKDESLDNIELHDNYISGTINLSRDKVLCMSIPYSKGWSATVDGKNVEIMRGNYMFMAIPLSAGHHVIEFTYCSPGLKIGLFVTVISTCIIVLMLMLDKRRKKCVQDVDI